MARTRLKQYLEKHGTRPTARRLTNPLTGEAGRDPSWLCRLAQAEARDIYVVKTKDELYLEEVKKL